MRDARMKPKHPDALSARAMLERWIQRGRMTQGEAADAIGISRIKLNQYLTSKARPSLETASRIEDTTGIGMRLWLVDDPDEVRRTPVHDSIDVSANGRDKSSEISDLGPEASKPS